MTEETWLDVVGFEGLYEISSSGRINSNLVGKGKNKRLLNPTINSTGYYRVALHNKKTSMNKKCYIHSLVALLTPVVT